MQAIYFDLDGTLADLYGVSSWCERLNAEDVTPYIEAEPLVSPEQLRMILLSLVDAGLVLGIISWGAMHASKEYNRETRKAKLEWCERYFPGCFTEFHVTKYGTPKQKVAKIKNSILVDDNPRVREKWTGDTIDASNSEEMVKALKMLLAAIQ